MKVGLLSFQFEANTFVNSLTYYEDFDIYRGDEMLDLIPCLDVFQRNNIEIVPILYANAIPGPIVENKSYFKIINEILDAIPLDLDGIWAYVHGSMYVDGVGSGEAYLFKKIREKIGYDKLISLAMDFHANNDVKLLENVNIMYGYRTAPHIDQAETQIRAAEKLALCLTEKLLPKQVFIKIPITAPGEMIMTDYEPIKSIINELNLLDNCEDIINVSFFAGHAWVDAQNNGASVVVTPYKNKQIADKICKDIAMMYWNNRHQIGFKETVVGPEESLTLAKASTEYPVFLSDSGDNVTAGSIGDNAWFLKLIQESDIENVLFASITDKCAVKKCLDLDIGTPVSLTIGATVDTAGVKTKIEGVLKNKSRVPSWSSDDGCNSVIVSCGAYDVIITEIAIPFISKNVFDRAGANIYDYKTIVVKAGYLFEDIAKYAGNSIMALTPGSSYADITKLRFHNILRPIYPIDTEFEFHV